jgi:hypothetical protein
LHIKKIAIGLGTAEFSILDFEDSSVPSLIKGNKTHDSARGE